MLLSISLQNQSTKHPPDFPLEQDRVPSCADCGSFEIVTDELTLEYSSTSLHILLYLTNTRENKGTKDRTRPWLYNFSVTFPHVTSLNLEIRSKSN